MQIGIIGINSKSSELSLRERLAVGCQRALAKGGGLAAQLSTVLLSTCNRLEVYFSAADLAEAHSDLLALLRAEIQIPFEHKLYSYFGVDCFKHLAKVTAGLDSAILAETEIQQQVKSSYAAAASTYGLDSAVHYLFQKSLKAAKGIRSSFPLPRGTPTIEGVIYDLTQNVLDLHSLFLIGNSEINRKLLFYFKKRGVSQITLCTRQPRLVQEQGIHVVDWSQLPLWKEHEVVICGTNAAQHLIKAEDVGEPALKNRFIFDLSVPRTVDPQVGKHPLIRLFNSEEIGKLVAATRDHHLSWASQAEAVLKTTVERQVDLFYSKASRKLLCS